jgi:hypothetical protein
MQKKDSIPVKHSKLRRFKSTCLYAFLAFMMVVFFSNSAVARVELTAEKVEAWANKIFGTAFEEKQFSGVSVVRFFGTKGSLN